jgi:hypothetical protein
MWATLSIAFLCGMAGWFAPWWIIVPIAFGMGLWQTRSASQAFVSGFLGVGLLWTFVAACCHLESGGLLSGRVAQMIGLPFPSSLPVLTGIIGGLLGGLAAMAGFYGRSVIKRGEDKR